ncbi:dihydrodipicolinate synthase family protein [Echinicola vietnamensis]|uniref:Dihydrodipicolinate synthase/N-acetylneuraminate lyase n=1 Tax=Echinicola vietnamensis (strain DSM 17526 / LMG 23754 / KMM 6221) TaxID=926556 RepID=L0G2V3_ECHVK|nr:dihydrodipicolinate synthase family protein [Echinicola vietnamensis]AGA80529.1 dihydrodipicolinate synthase/N-acetylneuraminate lyase [Echinicola vietnamensis DSM 17526]
MKFKKIHGLIAATFTPFCEDGSLDERKIPVLAQSLRANGMAGAFIAGTTGEGAAMTYDEKIRLLEAWAPFSAAEFKVMAMLGGTSQKEAIALADRANALGIYGIAMTAPYYMRPNSVKQLVDYYESIAAAAPDQAFYFYHIPLLSKVELPMLDFLEEVGERIPNFAGIKYTHNDLMEFNRCLRFQGGKYDILWGWDETMLAGLSMGAKGAVGSTYNYAGPLYQNLMEAFQQQDMEAARHWQEKSIDLISLFGHYGGAACGKAIMKLCGLDCGQFRYPVKQLEKGDYEELKECLDQLGFFQYSSNEKQEQ